MKHWQYPYFDLSAPIELATRREPKETDTPEYRTEFMRDRDRVLYCGSFRRLAGKTQIYLTGGDDHKRNRLTHTLEVSQIARTISRALGLDCDLTEAIALAHDLGHTPFGHAGEKMLHEIMVPGSPVNIKHSPMGEHLTGKNVYGFKHNVQSVRMVTTVEDGYGNAGLNLTNFTLWGIQNHSAEKYREGSVSVKYLDPDYRCQYNPYFYLPKEERVAWSFEAFVVREADEIAQWHHDLEDALRGNAMTAKDVCEMIGTALQPIMTDSDVESLSSLSNYKAISRQYIALLSKIVVNTLVNRIVECSYHNLEELWNNEIRGEEGKLKLFTEYDQEHELIQNAISFSKYGEKDPNISTMQKSYPSVIRERIHHSADVERMNAKGQYIIKKLFQAYWTHPQQLPDSTIIRYMVEVNAYPDINTARAKGIGAVRMCFEQFTTSEIGQEKLNRIKLMRRICDHIAGMTDHYAIEEYQNLYG